MIQSVSSFFGIVYDPILGKMRAEFAGNTISSSSDLEPDMISNEDIDGMVDEVVGSED